MIRHRRIARARTGTGQDQDARSTGASRTSYRWEEEKAIVRCGRGHLESMTATSDREWRTSRSRC